jgi:uroporphyrinogen decarboxylase
LELDQGLEKIDGEWGIWPPFERRILASEGDTLTIRTVEGGIARVRKDSGTLPLLLQWPVTDRASWERLKAERLQPTLSPRLPRDWATHQRAYETRDWPLGIGGPFLGVFSSLRTLMGFEGMMYAFYDQPQLMRDILDYLAEFWIALFDQVLAQTDVDYAYYWEDMSYKSGSMVSPPIFRAFLAPIYRRINAFFRRRGIDIILLDTDGSVWDLIPLFLECGITGLYPFEVRAGMDVAAVRAVYPRLQMMGGIDKNALVEGPRATDAELARIAPVIRSGGYIPAIDHYVPPNVPWSHFAYFRSKLAAML